MSEFGFEDLETIFQIVKLLDDKEPKCLRCGQPLEITQNSFQCINNTCKAFHRKQTLHIIQELYRKLETIIQKFIDMSLLEKEELEEHFTMLKTYLIIKKVDYIFDEHNKCLKCHSELVNVNGTLTCKSCNKEYQKEDISLLIQTIDELKQKVNIIISEKRTGKEIPYDIKRRVY